MGKVHAHRVHAGLGARHSKSLIDRFDLPPEGKTPTLADLLRPTPRAGGQP